MKYLTFAPNEYSSYKVCFLVPQLSTDGITRHYIEPHLKGAEEHLLAYDLLKGPKKTPAVIQKEYLAIELLPVLRDLEVEYLVVCDAEYFKTLTKGKSGEGSLGYVLESEGIYKDPDGEKHDFSGFKVLYCPNFKQHFYDPDKVDAAIQQTMHALTTHIQGTYVPPGQSVVKSEEYPTTPEEIQAALDKLLKMNCPLTSDIETRSLKHYDAGIGTITFCWNKTEGIAFGVDLMEGPDGMPIERPEQESRIIRGMLLDFFKAYWRSGHPMIWHNIAFDVYVMIYQLCMDDILDTEGLLEGLELFLTNWHCTKLITYLATNSCAGNKLGLKYQSHEYVGNYAVDGIDNIMAIPFKKLLKYNLVDGLATWHVYEKHHPTMVADQQEDIYVNLFQPTTVDIIQMQLTGMPIDMDEVLKLEKELEDFAEDAIIRMQSNTLVQALIYQMNLEWVTKRNNELKKKRVSMADANESFNPNSNPQLQRLLYDEAFMDLPVIDLTDTKAPATGGDTLKKLKNHTTKDEVIEFLDALIDFKAVDKLLTAFLPAFKKAWKGPDGWHYLFGNFNLGGTVSGRLSSSGPNLQNLPSNGYWAKKVKKCFKAPPGWLFVGLDYDSLEDRISALITRDPNKLKVYTDGFDGHCLRAYSYFSDAMPDIDPDDVNSINSIKKKYPNERQDSKTPTFLLTYGGTWMGIVDQMGWTEPKAKAVEALYHELYAVSDQVIADRVEQASRDGYATVAFGLRVRTPLLQQTVLGTRVTPHEAQGEARTVGNAMGQSYGLLNSRASVEFMAGVRKSEFRLSIRPCAHIHDAQYMMIRDNMQTLFYVNEHLVEAVKWQQDPAIAHPEVKLGGEVSVFYPSWAEEMVLPNDVSSEEFQKIAQKHLEDHELI